MKVSDKCQRECGRDSECCGSVRFRGAALESRHWKMSKLTGSNLGSPGGSPDLQLFRKACLTYCQHVAPERMTRRVAARPPGQRLCKTLLSRLARFGSNQRGCHRPSSTQYQKRPPLMVTFPGMARPRGLLAASRLALRASVFARRCCLAWHSQARLEPKRLSLALKHPIPKKATSKVTFPGMARPRG